MLFPSTLQRADVGLSVVSVQVKNLRACAWFMWSP